MTALSCCRKNTRPNFNLIQIMEVQNNNSVQDQNGNKSKPLLAVGFSTESGFKLTKKIETLDEFWIIINTDKSIFARHRMYPTSFFQSWNIKLIKKWLDAGWFFQAYR